jgi:hypothetical protein
MTEEEREEQVTMLRYFWEEYSDIEIYAGFEEMRPYLQDNYPEILKAWEDYKMSERMLSTVIKNL